MGMKNRLPEIRVEVVVRPEAAEDQRAALRAMAAAAVDRLWQEQGLPVPDGREQLHEDG